MELADKNTVMNILKNEGFTFKKSLGQNFLVDETVCPQMAKASCDGETGVIEIGPGAGVLTCELAKAAKRVVAIEVDKRLETVLEKTLSNAENVKIIYADALKIDLNEVIRENFSDCKRVAVCANLPYYITSPLIMSLLERRLDIDTVTVMVQREAAERICADVGTRQSGAVTVAVNYFAESELLFDVPSHCFMPPPKVDSAVIRLRIRDNPPVNVSDEKFFFAFVKACFAQRRKTVVNTVSNTLGIKKEIIVNALEKYGISSTVRGEVLNMEQLALLSDEIGGHNG